MDKLTAIKIKYDDGTYSDEIPVSALAENVEWDDTHTLMDVLGSVDVDITGAIQDQISQLFNEKIGASELNSYVASQLNIDVTKWLNTNVNPAGSAVVVDKSLSIEGAAADAKKTSDEIALLKEDLSNVFTEPLTWVQGTIHISTGKTIDDSDMIVVRTNAFYKFDSIIGFTISVPEGYTMRAYGYSTNNYTSYTGCSEYERNIVTNDMLPGESTFARFALRRDDAGEITPVTAPHMEFVKINLDDKPVTDTTLTLPGVPADSKKAGDEIALLKEDLSNVFTEPLTWVQGTIHISTGKTIDDSDTTVVRTNAFYKFDKAIGFKIAVPEGYTMRAYGYSTNNYTSYTGCSEYNRNMVTSAMLSGESTFARFVIRRTDAGEITPVTTPRVELDKISLVVENNENLREFKSEIKKKTQGIFEETDNLWPLGNYLKDTKRVLGEFGKEFPAGTYTLTMDVITNDVDSYRSKFQLYKGAGGTYLADDMVVTDLAFNQNERTSVTFTASEPFTRFRIYASWTEMYSENDTIIIKNIQLVSGDKPSEYKPPVIDNYNNAMGEIVTFTNFAPGYISTDHITGDVINLANVTADATASYIVIPCNEEDAFLIEAIGVNNTDKRAVMFLDANFALIKKKWYTDDRTNDNYVAFDPHERIVYTPTGTKWIVVNHFTDEYISYSPKVYKLSDNVLYNYLATYNYGLLPFTPVQDWKTHVVATYKSMVVIFKNGVVKLSKDCGYTWNSGVNISALGDISAFYLYANGTLAIFTDAKAYYIEDWTEYHEAVCYEIDGTLFTSETSSNFYLTKSHTERKFVNGNDIFMFTNYHTGTVVRSLVWCSFDQGHTYKIIWEFGSRDTPTPTGSWQIRHGHDVIYYEPEDIFILCTGDSNATECMVFTVSLDVEHQSCEVSLVGGPARGYKWSNMALWNNEIYYTQDNTPGSVWKCKYEDIGDLSKHEKILDGLYSDPTCLMIGNRGEMVVFCSESRNLGDYTGTFPFDSGTTARQIFYSSNRKTFVGAWLPVLALANKKSLLKHIKPVMSDGSLFALTYAKNGRVSFCLSDFLKSVGIVNAFAPVL